MNKNHIVLLGIALILPTAAAVGALFVVPRFAEMFAAFGAELPLSTRVLLATYRGWLAFPLLVLAVGLCWPSAKNRPVAAVLAGTFSAFAMLAFVLWACYAPIFRLAAQGGE
jgi:hypothetical protein